MKFSTTRIDTRPIKDIFSNADSRINYSFTIGETDYYCFDDINSVPCLRGFQALSYYNELSMGCTREYLLTHNQALKDIVNTQPINLTKLVTLVLQMDERLNFLLEPEIAYKLCSVVFFDDTENPNNYEYKHGAKKAQIFKDCPLNDFFLSVPIVKLIPYINSLGNDLQEYCQAVMRVNQKHLENISTMLSEASKRSASYKLLMLQMLEDSASQKSTD